MLMIQWELMVDVIEKRGAAYDILSIEKYSYKGNGSFSRKWSVQGAYQGPHLQAS